MSVSNTMTVANGTVVQCDECGVRTMMATTAVKTMRTEVTLYSISVATIIDSVVSLLTLC
jgi:hypothetical protein